MNRRRFITLAVGAGSLLGWPGLPPTCLARVERKSWALGAGVSLVVYHENRDTAEQALSAAFKALNDIEEVLSLYRPQGQICRLNRDGVLDRPHPDLVRVLRSAITWSRLTDGAFDPTVQPLWKLYAQGGVPDADRLQASRQLVDWRKVEVHDHRVRLGPGQAVTLNGIAQGFAADRVRDVLKAHGIRYARQHRGVRCHQSQAGRRYLADWDPAPARSGCPCRARGAGRSLSRHLGRLRDEVQRGFFIQPHF